MDLRGVVRAVSVGRLAIGAGMVLAPRVLGAAWVGEGAHAPGAAVMTRAFAAREAFLGGATYALIDTPAAPAVVAAGALCDGVDLAATLLERDALPTPAVVAVGTAAAGALVGGLAYAAALARS
jgi:hypothetical protein